MFRIRNFASIGAALVLTMGLAFSITAADVGAAQAQEISAEHLEAAKHAVAASQSTRTLDDILPNLAEQAKQQLIANRPDAAEQLTQIVDDVAVELAPRRGALEEEVARGYARIFTISELNEIAAFYNTEAGKKLITETPTVARAIDQAASVWSNGIQRDLREQIQKKMQEAGLL